MKITVQTTDLRKVVMTSATISDENYAMRRSDLRKALQSGLRAKADIRVKRSSDRYHEGSWCQILDVRVQFLSRTGRIGCCHFAGEAMQIIKEWANPKQS